MDQVDVQDGGYHNTVGQNHNVTSNSNQRAKGKSNRRSLRSGRSAKVFSRPGPGEDVDNSNIENAESPGSAKGKQESANENSDSEYSQR